jgi:hypothetical protein
MKLMYPFLPSSPRESKDFGELGLMAFDLYLFRYLVGSLTGEGLAVGVGVGVGVSELLIFLSVSFISLISSFSLLV